MKLLYIYIKGPFRGGKKKQIKESAPLVNGRRDRKKQ